LVGQGDAKAKAIPERQKEGWQADEHGSLDRYVQR